MYDMQLGVDDELWEKEKWRIPLSVPFANMSDYARTGEAPKGMSAGGGHERLKALKGL